MADSSPPSIDTSIPSPWLVWLSEGCGLGRMKKAPGTWGSLGGLPVVWLLQLAPAPELACGTGAVLMFLIGIPICAAGMRHYRAADPGHVVFDEIAAFPIVFLLVPINWMTALLGFGLFRLFDISKPGPVRWAEKIPGATGVMADDTVAGVLAGVALTAIHVLLLAP